MNFSAAISSVIFHVAVTGSDCNTGLDEANALATIQAAYDKMISCHKQGMLSGTTTIFVHAGDYCLAKPLHFTSDIPVEIRPFGQDKVTISGGTPLTGWKKAKLNGKTVWKTVLPETVSEVPFLFVNGKLATAARWPKKDFFRAGDDRGGFQTNDENCDNFLVTKGDFDPKWYDPQNIFINMVHLWIEEPLKIKSFDEKTGRLTTASAMRYVAGKGNTEYAFYNVKEKLSEAGEYYFDRNTRELFLIPEAEKFEAVVPECGTLVRFDSGVKNVTLTGLNFRYGGTHWPLFDADFDLRDPGFEPLVNRAWNITAWKNGKGKKVQMPTYSGPQGASHVPGVILFNHASDCAIRNCTVSACAWYAIHAAEGCTNLTFTGNEISGMGGGGFYIGGGAADAVKNDPSLLTGRIIVKGNHIHDCGLFFYSAIGVLITHGCGCLVEGNHIHDLLYSGVSCGWVWGYGDSVSRENRICRNHIHDLGKGILSDMGGVYLLGIQPGTHVYENVIHDIVNRYYGGWGLYTDEGSSHIVLERNVVYNCACEGFHQHYGRENIIRHNIFAFNKDHGMCFTHDAPVRYEWPGEPHAKAVNVYNNVIVTDGTPTYKTGNREMIENKRIHVDNNIIFDVSGKQKIFARDYHADRNYTPDEWRKRGFDAHSQFCDPGFRNLRKYDFRLKKDSILREYGFDFLDEVLKNK